MNRTTRLAVLTAALTLLPTVALAHPSFNPNQVPAGEPVEAVLVVPHGCAPGGGMPDGDALATIRVSLEHQDAVTVEGHDIDGWDVADDGEAVVWSDAGGATTEPISLPVTLVVAPDTAVGDLYLSVFQECEDGESFRWIGTPEAEADWPAVLLEVTEGEVGTAETVDEHSSDGDDMDMAEGEADGEGVGEDVMDATSDGAAALTGEEADDGIAVGIVIALVAVALLIVGGLVAVNRGKSAT
jgi:uncharacterized protein YcnI